MLVELLSVHMLAPRRRLGAKACTCTLPLPHAVNAPDASKPFGADETMCLSTSRRLKSALRLAAYLRHGARSEGRQRKKKFGGAAAKKEGLEIGGSNA